MSTSAATVTRKDTIGGRKVIPTLTEFLMSTQPKDSKGDFTLLMIAIQTAVKVIEKHIRKSGIRGTTGYMGNAQANQSGDEQAKLDVIANEVFIANLMHTERVLILGCLSASQSKVQY